MTTETKELDKRITDIPEGMSVFMHHPRIQFMMCGIIKMKQDNKGLISLMYEDGSIEERICEKYIEDMNCFETVRRLERA